jgi:transposase
MGYLWLVPSESTSSDKRRQGGITKTGNSHARWILIECAQHYATPPKVSKELSHRQSGQPREVLALSWKAQNRLHSRFVRLAARRLPRNKIVVTIARELCAFIWALLRNQSSYLQSVNILSKRPKGRIGTSGEPRFPATPPLRGTTTNYH